MASRTRQTQVQKGEGGRRNSNVRHTIKIQNEGQNKNKRVRTKIKEPQRFDDGGGEGDHDMTEDTLRCDGDATRR